MKLTMRFAVKVDGKGPRWVFAGVSVDDSFGEYSKVDNDDEGWDGFDERINWGLNFFSLKNENIKKGTKNFFFLF